MPRVFNIHRPPETAYVRNVLIGVEVIDAISLARVTDGLTVEAKGLVGKPIVNFGGCFVWLKEGDRRPEKIVVDPGHLPYQKAEVAILLPPPYREPIAVELQPGRHYPFAPGTTGLRSTLYESPDDREPYKAVPDTDVWLRWLGPDDNWTDSPVSTRTDSNGDFVAILRLPPLAPADFPHPPSSAPISVRLCANFAEGTRMSDAREVALGRVTDAAPFQKDKFTT